MVSRRHKINKQDATEEREPKWTVEKIGSWGRPAFLTSNKTKTKYMNAEDALEQFRRKFPFAEVFVEETQMRYNFGRNVAFARRFEAEARALIINQHLPLCADLAIWERKGCVLGVQLIIKIVPVEDLVA